ncbi:hypothetical protein C7S18_08320 [Ahniella affigens]|uniref:AAA+ ATPase domain-containing protein n=1 Tax=Ahniella affigens TaxID=2021234 RepID=A0A2P1PQT2_9GAMM|nr:TniB family NTP-binding protein [Ahniella affigens]AVP97199.1 hypothetical protein C7S18_08320 [Ahniella affigens]
MKSPQRYSHLDDHAAAGMTLPDDERVQFILADRFIRHRALNKLMIHLETLVLEPRRVRAWGLVITGDPGAGKTMLATSLSRRFAPITATDDAPQQVPIVSISMTGAREAKTIFNRTLEALGIPIVATLRGSDREELAIRMLRQLGVRLLIVDEIQDILNSTPRQQRIALDTVKLLMNEVKIPILALGIPKAILAMKADPHLNARFDYRELPSWKDNNDFEVLLHSLVRNLPLANPSHLTTTTLVRSILERTEGTLARIVRLIRYAAVHAILTGRECIDAQMLDLADEVPDLSGLTPPQEAGIERGSAGRRQAA